LATAVLLCAEVLLHMVSGNFLFYLISQSVSSTHPLPQKTKEVSDTTVPVLTWLLRPAHCCFQDMAPVPYFLYPNSYVI
jgi:hypothetical protein